MSMKWLDLAVLAALVATSMTVACAWPQLRGLRRTGDTAGVSLATAALSCAAETGWAVYLTGAALWSAVPEAVLTFAVSAALVRALLRAGVSWRRPALAATGWLAALLVARVSGGPAALGALLSVTYAVQLMPAVWTAWRCAAPTGIAATSWIVRLTQSVLWGAYGMVRGDRPLVALGLIGTTASAAVLARVAVTRSLALARPQPA